MGGEVERGRGFVGEEANRVKALLVDSLFDGVEGRENVGGGCGRDNGDRLAKLPPNRARLDEGRRRSQQRGYFPSRN